MRNKQDEDLGLLLKRIGIRLAELRLKKGYTSHENFAFDHELQRSYYWAIEKGKTNLTMKSLLGLLHIHGISFDAFVASLPSEKSASRETILKAKKSPIRKRSK